MGGGLGFPKQLARTRSPDPDPPNPHTHHNIATAASHLHEHRAQRSLARNALRNSNYVKAAGHWEAALALNPLHGEGWFRWAGWAGGGGGPGPC